MMNIAELRDAIEGWPNHARVAVEFTTVEGHIYGGDATDVADRGQVFVIEATSYPVER